MFTAILLAAILSAAVSSESFNESTSSHLLAWTNYKKDFNKTYATLEEDQNRMKTFLANEETIKKHNERYKNGQTTFYLKTNEYSDMTDEEFQKFTQKKQPILFRTSRNQENRNDDEYFIPDRTAKLPDTLDWRLKGVDTPVERQGDCGSCWAITTAASLESAYIIKTGRTVILSPQELSDCSRYRENNACEGGWVDDAYSYVMENGLAGVKDYPRPFQRTSVQGCLRGAIAPAVEQKGFLRIRPGREDDLKNAVATVGPVAVSTQVEEMAWKLYRGGVLVDRHCSDKFDTLNHATLCVGYGTENGTDYWLLKNTWGDGWGLDGYIKVQRNAGNQCGIATEALFAVL